MLSIAHTKYGFHILKTKKNTTCIIIININTRSKGKNIIVLPKVYTKTGRKKLLIIVEETKR